MKALFVALVALACGAAALQASDDLVIDHFEMTVPTEDPVLVGVDNRKVDVTPKNIDIATIITIGKTVWEIIKEGKPVVDYKTDWAGAVPKGVSWTELEHFRDYKWGPFGWTFKNKFGMETVRFSWNFSWSCKGSYNGHGSFLMNVGAAVSEIYAAWGFTVNVNVSVDQNPTNYGTKVDPIAGLAVEVTLDVRSVLQSFTERCRVRIRGDCQGAKIAC